MSGGPRRGRTLRRPRSPVPAARRGSPPAPGGPAGGRAGGRPSVLQRWRPVRSDPRQDRRQPGASLGLRPAGPPHSWLLSRSSLSADLAACPLDTLSLVRYRLMSAAAASGSSLEVDFTEAPFHPAAARATTGRAASATRWSAPPGVPPPWRRGPAVAAPSGDSRCYRSAFSRQ